MSLWGILGGGCGFVVIFLTLVQIAPIKVDPWSAFAKKIGRAINGELIQKVDKLSTEVSHLKHTINEKEAVNCRARILRFNDEMLSGKKHTQEHFQQIFADIDIYERYCSMHNEFKNNITVLTVNNIERVYAQCLEDNTFL